MRAGADMRQHHDIWQRQQRQRHDWFVGEHVEARAMNHTLAQSIDQRVLIDHRTPRDIDQNAA